MSLIIAIMKQTDLNFRPTTLSDVAFVLATESHKDNNNFVTSQTEEEHRQYIADPNVFHLIIERVADSAPLGYIILLKQDKVVEFRRIVVAEKGLGIGALAIRWIKHFAFEECKAHRLWLDVVVQNERARALYKSQGFVEEGILRECAETASGWNSYLLMSMLEHEYTPSTK
jgi:RimJ/RimL family protein N-acetyltransferase